MCKYILTFVCRYVLAFMCVGMYLPLCVGIYLPVCEVYTYLCVPFYASVSRCNVCRYCVSVPARLRIIVHTAIRVLTYIISRDVCWLQR